MTVKGRWKVEINSNSSIVPCPTKTKVVGNNNTANKSGNVRSLNIFKIITIPPDSKDSSGFSTK